MSMPAHKAKIDRHCHRVYSIRVRNGLLLAYEIALVPFSNIPCDQWKYLLRKSNAAGPGLIQALSCLCVPWTPLGLSTAALVFTVAEAIAYPLIFLLIEARSVEYFVKGMP